MSRALQPSKPERRVAMLMSSLTLDEDTGVFAATCKQCSMGLSARSERVVLRSVVEHYDHVHGGDK